MHYDSRLGDDDAHGYILVESNTVPDDLRYAIEKEAEGKSVEEIDKEGRIYLFLTEPAIFRENLPKAWQRFDGGERKGIPPNVMVGSIFSHWEDSIEKVAALLEIWPRVRFAALEGDVDPEPFLLPSRCSNCGTRYISGADRCRNINLCGESLMVPLIPWVISSRLTPEMAKRYNAVPPGGRPCEPYWSWR